MFIASHYAEFELAGETIWFSEVYDRSSPFLLFWRIEILLYQFNKMDMNPKRKNYLMKSSLESFFIRAVYLQVSQIIITSSYKGVSWIH